MRLDDVLVLAADTGSAAARRRLQALASGMRVVVRLEWDGVTSFYAFRAGEVLAALGADEVTLAGALGLLELQPTDALELDDMSARGPRATTVLVHGDEVLGVLVPDRAGPTRGLDLSPPPAPGPPAPASGAAAPASGAAAPASGAAAPGSGAAVPAPSATPPPVSFPVPVEPPPSPPPAPAPSPPSRPPSPPATDEAVFTAYPRVRAPEAVVAETAFDVRVGVAAVGAAEDVPMRVRLDPTTPEAPVRFFVAVMGKGFDFPDGVRAELVAPRRDFDAAEVVLRAVGQPVDADVVRVLEVSYEHEGDVVGRAWREVRVCAGALPEGALPPMRSGGTGIAQSSAPAPHLTIEIRSRQGDPELEWLFHTREGLAGPDTRVTTALAEGSAKEFAIQVMNQVPAQQGSPLLGLTMTGIGRRVSAALPAELWPLLEATWRGARAAGEVPTLLLLTNEPWVPWELAWLDSDYVDPALLPSPREPDVDPGAALGALWQVGRWVPPIARTPRGGDRPATPPSSRVGITDVAVVIGDYASDVSLRPLPEAVAEGTELAQRYGALPLKATEQDMERLLRNRLSRDGSPFAPTMVHIAAHGEVSPDNQQYSGIILSQTQRRLDPLVVLGSELTRETRPFVFLNACQVGTAGAFLSEYGGMPGAFLSEGCRGFVAPLWNVDDTVAHQLALRFYDATLGRGTPVAESLRQIRQVFGTPWDNGTATPLAYVFYGHPALVLDRGQPEPARIGHGETEGGDDGGS